MPGLSSDPSAASSVAKPGATRQRLFPDPAPIPDWLPGRLTLATGTAADYRALARWHYRAGKPATWATIITIHHELPNVSINSRLLRGSRGTCAAILETATDLRRSAAQVPRLPRNGSKHLNFDCDNAARMSSVVAAVGVLSWPTACSRPRSRVFGLDGATYGERLRWANANIRTISRVIVRPAYRGAGLAGVVIRELIARCKTPYIDATAAMAACHPMFEHAGLTRHDEPGYPPYFWSACDS